MGGGVTNLFPITLINNGGVPNDTYAKVYTELQKIGNGRLDFTIDSGLIFIDLSSEGMGSNNYEVTTVSADEYNGFAYALAEFEDGPEIIKYILTNDGVFSVIYM